MTGRTRDSWHGLCPPVAVSILLATLVGPCVLARSEPLSTPTASQSFAPGEQYTYSISWLSIPAGTAVMQVSDMPVPPRGPLMRLLTTARSNAFVSIFYPVDNRIESILDVETLTPQRMVFRRREGRRENDFSYTFRHAEGEVVAVKDGVAETLAIPPGTQDAISCLYYLRSLPSLVPGSSLVMNVHHDKKNYKLQVKVEELERVEGPWGSVDAVRVLAVMPFRGIFMNEGNIRVWLTNDIHHIPVMMKAKVMIGSVVARLVDGWRTPPAP